MVKLYSSLLILFLLLGCDSLEKSKKPSKKITDGVVKQYRTDGELKNEITFKDGKKHGLAKTYYKDGMLHQEIEYINNVQHGLATTYYETGKVYQITPYDSGKINGIRKKYRKNGDLMAEIPYDHNSPCKGLKEYLLDGSLKKKYPKIIVKTIDNILKNGKYKLRFTISDNSRNVDYYPGTELTKNGCFKEIVRPMSSQKKGMAELTYTLPVGTFLMEEIKMVAVVTTRLGSPFVTDITYNLALENRGF
jgi:hypothetical protein